MMGYAPSKEQPEKEYKDEPPEGEYEDNEAYSEKSMKSANESGKAAVHGRMNEMQQMRKEDTDEKKAKLAKYRRMWDKMKPVNKE